MALSVKAPDVEMAATFLGLIAPDGEVTFQTRPERAGLNPGIASKISKVLHGPLEKHAPFLCAANEQGAAVYYMPNKGDGIIHPGDRTCRTQKNVIGIRALFVDLDGAPLDPLLTSNPSPTAIVESSPGRYHGYWAVQGCPIERFSEMQLRLAAKFAGDRSVHDLPRLMRLPGFLHWKKEPHLTSLLRFHKETRNA